ncbi:MAG: NAD-dependent epimerase/dehydratase family protein [Gammaproteobacteria bacterium]|nr:NAD-dependent epimerase/dehydratase family protein [Gammaproteobacteria bacterium]
MDFWTGKNVLVTGGAGFVGSHVAEILVENKANVTILDNLSNGSVDNLERIQDSIEFIDADMKILDNCLAASKNKDVVMNLAAKVGGIEYNKNHPGTMFRDNIIMNTNMLEAARQNDVERFQVISSACVYPRLCTIPTPESEGFLDVPEPTNDGYGWAKRMAEVQANTYTREYGMKISVIRPYNAYGPRDHFDPDKSHVIPALIKRIFDGEDPLTVWGDGEQTRSFLYVTDFAKGLIEAIEKYPVADPINLGTDEEIKIKYLVELIVELSGKSPKIVFDTTKPSGQPRRNCDTTKYKDKIGFVPEVNLHEGLKNTIEWYAARF